MYLFTRVCYALQSCGLQWAATIIPSSKRLTKVSTVSVFACTTTPFHLPFKMKLVYRSKNQDNHLGQDSTLPVPSMVIFWFILQYQFHSVSQHPKPPFPRQKHHQIPRSHHQTLHHFTSKSTASTWTWPMHTPQALSCASVRPTSLASKRKEWPVTSGEGLTFTVEFTSDSEPGWILDG